MAARECPTTTARSRVCEIVALRLEAIARVGLVAVIAPAQVIGDDPVLG